MSDREKMLEATLDLVDGGIAILDAQSKVLFWNTGATTLTGYLAQEVIAQRCPSDLYCIDEAHRSRFCAGASPSKDGVDADATICSTFVLMSHKLGHLVPGMLRRVALKDSLGEVSGTALLFYPVEDMDALPHGEACECADVERIQADMEDRLDAAQHQWAVGRTPFGLLWITVDQAHALRKTHGHDACEAMMRTVEHTLLRQLRPGEILGRWGNNEFLVLAHERSVELLLEHSQRLAGLARTADFRWWGDRVGLTVSIGASQATEGETLQSLLNRARHAMQTSAYGGGNHATEAREG